MGRVTIRCLKEQLPVMNRFVVDRIPNRSGWSLAKGPPKYRASKWTVWYYAEEPELYVYWFAKRYEWVGFELKLHYG